MCIGSLRNVSFSENFAHVLNGLYLFQCEQSFPQIPTERYLPIKDELNSSKWQKKHPEFVKQNTASNLKVVLRRTYHDLS